MRSARTKLAATIGAAAAALMIAPGAGRAAELPLFSNAPAIGSAPAAKSAVQFQLQLRLPQGRGLARLLLDAGVDRGDAAAAARLAAGHLGDGTGGCDVKVSVSTAAAGNGYRVERVTLLTQASQTVIERRRGELTVASQVNAGNISLV